MKYEFYWPVLWQYREALIHGLALTMYLFGAGILCSSALGLLMGTAGTARRWWLRVCADTYVELNRNTPLVVKLFFLYYGVGLEPFSAAIVGLSVHQSAYMAEVIRACIQSVGRGQTEAGLSTGLPRRVIMRRIVWPQALVMSIPPMTTQILEVLKNSSIAMTITIAELTFQTNQIEAYSFRGFEAATAATVAYLLIGALIAGAATALEWHLQHKYAKLGQPILGSTLQT